MFAFFQDNFLPLDAHVFADKAAFLPNMIQTVPDILSAMRQHWWSPRQRATQNHKWILSNEYWIIDNVNRLIVAHYRHGKHTIIIRDKQTFFRLVWMLTIYTLYTLYTRTKTFCRFSDGWTKMAWSHLLILETRQIWRVWELRPA